MMVGLIIDTSFYRCRDDSKPANIMGIDICHFYGNPEQGKSQFDMVSLSLFLLLVNMDGNRIFPVFGS